MFDSLAKMFSGVTDSISGLLGGGGSGGGFNDFLKQNSLTPDQFSAFNPAEQKGIMGSFDTLNGAGANSLAGMFKGLSLKDLSEFGLGLGALSEMKKNNKIERRIGEQQVNENDRIRLGREDTAAKFNSGITQPPSLAAGYIG